jgi:hypothetical protein
MSDVRTGNLGLLRTGLFLLAIIALGLAVGSYGDGLPRQRTRDDKRATTSDEVGRVPRSSNRGPERTQPLSDAASSAPNTDDLLATRRSWSDSMQEYVYDVMPHERSALAIQLALDYYSDSDDVSFAGSAPGDPHAVLSECVGMSDYVVVPLFVSDGSLSGLVVLRPESGGDALAMISPLGAAYTGEMRLSPVGAHRDYAYPPINADSARAAAGASQEARQSNVYRCPSGIPTLPTQFSYKFEESASGWVGYVDSVSGVVE